MAVLPELQERLHLSLVRGPQLGYLGVFSQEPVMQTTETSTPAAPVTLLDRVRAVRAQWTRDQAGAEQRINALSGSGGYGLDVVRGRYPIVASPSGSRSVAAERGRRLLEAGMRPSQFTRGQWYHPGGSFGLFHDFLDEVEEERATKGHNPYPGMIPADGAVESVAPMMPATPVPASPPAELLAAPTPKSGSIVWVRESRSEPPPRVGDTIRTRQGPRAVESVGPKYRIEDGLSFGHPFDDGWAHDLRVRPLNTDEQADWDAGEASAKAATEAKAAAVAAEEAKGKAVMAEVQADGRVSSESNPFPGQPSTSEELSRGKEYGTTTVIRRHTMASGAKYYEVSSSGYDDYRTTYWAAPADIVAAELKAQIGKGSPEKWRAEANNKHASQAYKDGYQRLIDFAAANPDHPDVKAVHAALVVPEALRPHIDALTAAVGQPIRDRAHAEELAAHAKAVGVEEGAWDGNPKHLPDHKPVQHARAAMLIAGNKRSATDEQLQRYAPMQAMEAKLKESMPAFKMEARSLPGTTPPTMEAVMRGPKNDAITVRADESGRMRMMPPSDYGRRYQFPAFLAQHGLPPSPPMTARTPAEAKARADSDPFLAPHEKAAFIKAGAGTPNTAFHESPLSGDLHGHALRAKLSKLDEQQLDHTPADADGVHRIAVKAIPPGLSKRVKLGTVAIDPDGNRTLHDLHPKHGHLLEAALKG